MLFRFTGLCVALLTTFSYAQTSSTAGAPTVKVFHDPQLDINFAYPASFTPVPADAPKAAPATEKAAAQPQCVRSILTAGSEDKLGSSAFVVSVIDSACPGVLKDAQQPGSFTRDQILRQLKRYGTPTLIQDPVRYTIDERPAAVTLAMAHPEEAAAGAATATSGATTPPATPAPAKPVTTYAAKACFLRDIPEHQSGKRGPGESGEVVCFDFTTQSRELLNKTLSFMVELGTDGMHPVVPGNALR
jgi:hypothetical protein